MTTNIAQIANGEAGSSVRTKLNSIITISPAKADGTPVTVVVLTQAQYDALGTPDANTLYAIAG